MGHGSRPCPYPLTPPLFAFAGLAKLPSSTHTDTHAGSDPLVHRKHTPQMETAARSLGALLLLSISLPSFHGSALQRSRRVLRLRSADWSLPCDAADASAVDTCAARPGSMVRSISTPSLPAGRAAPRMYVRNRARGRQSRHGAAPPLGTGFWASAHRGDERFRSDVSRPGPGPIDRWLLRCARAVHGRPR